LFGGSASETSWKCRRSNNPISSKAKAKRGLIMKKLAVVAVNMWLSHLFGSLLVMGFIGAGGPVHAAEFFCGNVTCLIAKINEANTNAERWHIHDRHAKSHEQLRYTQ
jgi:hypothetical protein